MVWSDGGFTDSEWHIGTAAWTLRISAVNLHEYLQEPRRPTRSSNKSVSLLRFGREFTVDRALSCRFEWQVLEAAWPRHTCPVNSHEHL